MQELITQILMRDWTGAGLTILAGIGGMLAHIVQAVENGKPVNWREGLVQFCASGFVGYLVYGLCMAIGVGGLWLGPIVGMFGWLGAVATIQVLRRFVFDKLGIPHDEEGKP